jgi:hypothetical protein
MLRRVTPPGTVLPDVRLEYRQEGRTCGRELGTYALLVGVGTLPLLYAGIASYAAPHTLPEAGHSFSVGTALRHVLAGISYVLAAAVVGAISMGIQIATPSGFAVGPAVLQPLFLLLGGLIIAGAFVGLQLWRYETFQGTLTRDTVLGTAVLGVLLAVSPIVANWVFGGNIG